MEVLETQRAYIQIDRTIMVHYAGTVRDFPLKHGCQRNVILTELMPDPERSILANIIKQSGKSSYRGTALDSTADDNFRTNVLKNSNAYLKKNFPMLGKWSTNPQNRMFLGNATSNIRQIWEAAREDQWENIPELFGKYPTVGIKDLEVIEQKYIRTCVKGYRKTAKSLIQKQVCCVKTLSLFEKFNVAYPFEEEIARLHMILLWLCQKYEEIDTVYQRLSHALIQKNQMPSSITQTIHKEGKERAERWLLAPLSQDLFTQYPLSFPEQEHQSLPVPYRELS